MKNKKLYNSIKSYSKFALELVRSENVDLLEKEASIEFGTLPFIMIKDKLTKSYQYQECFQILKKDKKVSSHFDVMIGRHIRQSRSKKPEQIMLSLPLMGVYKKKLEFNEDQFDREYTEFEKFFQEDSLSYEVVAPLYGINIKEAVKFSDNLEIKRINQIDLSFLLENENVDEDSELGRYFWAIRTTYKLPKIVGDDEESSLEKAKENDLHREEANNLIEKVLICLRLFGIANVYPMYIVHRTKPWMFNDIKQYPIRYFPDTQFQVNYGSIENGLIDFWKMFTSDKISKRKFISVAAKRFSYSHERHDWEDKIIDLLIAAEAVFLSDSSGSELSYRLALRSAILLGKDFQSRKTIFDNMKLAYTLRSNIVHGSGVESTIKKIRKKETSKFGEEYKMTEFISSIQEYIRIAILRVVQELYQSPEDRKSLDWEKLILGSKEDKPQ